MNSLELKDFIETQPLAVVIERLKTLPLGLKALGYAYLQESNEEVLEVLKTNPQEYLKAIDAYINFKNAKYLLPANLKLLVAMIHTNFQEGEYVSFLSDLIFSHTQFSHLNEEEQDLVVDNLILKNKLKASSDFLKRKINQNLLFNKVENKKLQYSFGFKKVDEQIIKLIGENFSQALESGWALNQGPREEFRHNIQSILEHISQAAPILALIREDNIKAHALVKEFNFKVIKKIPSPWSENTLLVYQYFN